MGRFILRFTGRGSPSDSDLAQISSAPGITIVEKASPRMLLVQASPEMVRKLAAGLSGWTYSAERSIPLPDPRPKLRSS
jgi:hypothetical protein